MFEEFQIFGHGLYLAQNFDFVVDSNTLQKSISLHYFLKSHSKYELQGVLSMII